MTAMFSQGMPCDPAIVNGVTFEDRGDDVWVGEVPEGEEDSFTGVPSFTLTDPNPPKLTKAAAKAAAEAAATSAGPGSGTPATT